MIFEAGILLLFGSIEVFTALHRQLLKRRLDKQLSSGKGYFFTPTKHVWDAYLTEHESPGFALTVIAYSVFTAALFAVNADRTIWAINLFIGTLLLYRYLTRAIPPTFGVTEDGITILSWSPPFPIGSFNAASAYIPWHKVTICEMQEKGLVILTEHGETQVVYTPEQEDEICAFVDVILSNKGYRVDTLKT